MEMAVVNMNFKKGEADRRTSELKKVNTGALVLKMQHESGRRL